MPIHTRLLFFSLATIGLAIPVARAEDPDLGERIYRDKCAVCHGEKGEGNPDEYPHPLAGDRSIAQLARLIERTMPADEPGTCKGDDAQAVAKFIHDAFYSKAARERNKPARVELARLTVRQYRNAVTDLVGGFQGWSQWDKERGLRGQYFNSPHHQDKERVIDRRDPVVKFDFGAATPEAGKFKPEEYSIRWDGSVWAPESGDYEFIVRAENGFRLYVNDNGKALIDAGVRSGSDTEYKESIRLLGGRPYRIRLDLRKAKEDKIAKVSLEWKPPGGVVEVIPERFLAPHWADEVFVVSAAFPPDDRSVGYERGTSVSKAWDQGTTDGAIEAAGYVVAHLRGLAGVKDDAPDRAEKLKAFCRTWAERAFRRPLADEEKALYIDRQFDGAPDLETAVKRVILLTLKSPRFLYREVGGDPEDPYNVASRLSFALWDSLPDEELRKAADKGELSNRDQVMRQAERMAGNIRAKAKLREFFVQWLRVDRVIDLSKDPGKYPGFDASLVADLRASLELFLDDVVWGEASDFRQLLLADTVHLNGRLAKFYGASLPEDAPFQKVALDPGERAGILSHPFLMAAFAYTGSTSPIHRGVFVARGLLGQTLRPPPEAVSPLAPDLHKDLTTRERVTLQTEPQACQSCHRMINPLGFAMERFDAVGRLRTEESGKPIDAQGGYEARSGDPVSFAGARGLATFLASSEEVHTAFVEQLFHHTVKQPIRAYGSFLGPDLRQSFANGGFHIRKLMLEIAVASALNVPKAAPAESPAVSSLDGSPSTPEN